MSTDAGQPLGSSDDRRDIWRLPEVLDVRTVRRRLDQPKRLTIRGEDRYLDDVMEVEVEVSEPFEVRALGPVLWIGDEPLTIAEEAGENRYRFLVPEPAALLEGAPVELSWNTPDAPRSQTKYTYREMADLEPI